MKGDTISFWDDLFNGVVHSQKYPWLFEFAKDTSVSLQHVRETDPFLSCFRIPMTRVAYNEFLALEAELLQMPSDISGAASSILQVDTINISLLLCILPKPSSGYGRQNVSQRLNSLPGYCLMIDSILGIC